MRRYHGCSPATPPEGQVFAELYMIPGSLVGHDNRRSNQPPSSLPSSTLLPPSLHALLITTLSFRNLYLIGTPSFRRNHACVYRFVKRFTGSLVKKKGKRRKVRFVSCRHSRVYKRFLGNRATMNKPV